MLFYQIDAKLDEEYGELLAEEIRKEGKCEDGHESAMFRKFKEATADWNDRLTDKMYFVSEIKRDFITFGLISKDEPEDFCETSDYLFYLGICFEYIEVAEEMFSDIFGLRPSEKVFPGNVSSMADRDDRRFYKMIGISNRMQEAEVIGNIVDENMFMPDDFGDEDYRKRVREIRRKNQMRFPSRSLDEEIARIELTEVSAEEEEAPVFYVIESDDEDFQMYAAVSLMRELYGKGRITSTKFMGMYGFSAGLSPFVVKTFSRICGHGSLIFRFTEDEGDANPYSDGVSDVNLIIHIAGQMTELGDHTQTFFFVPRICDEEKLLLFENREKYKFVEIRQNREE